MTRTSTLRSLSRRRVGVLAVAALALAGVVAPGVAEAAGELPGGTTPATAVAVALDSSFPGSNLGATSVGSYITAPGALPYWSATVWYSFATTVPGTVTALTSSNTYDTTLEIWTSAQTFVTQNDDASGPTLASAVQAVVPAGTYLLGLGGWNSGKGTATVSLDFSPAIPTAPTGLLATPGDGVASVSWDALAAGWEVTGYDLSCTENGGAPYLCGSTVAPAPGEPAPTALDLTGLTNGSVYTVSVTATNASGVSPVAGPVSVTPQAVTATTVTVAPTTLVSGQAFVVIASVTDVSDSTQVTAGSITVTVDGVPVADADPGAGFTSAPLMHLAGPMTVVATYSGTGAFLASSGTVSLTVAQQTQALTLDPLPADLVFGDTVVPHATSSHGLPVTFSATGACTVVVVDGVQELHMTGVGACELTASQAGTSEVTSASATASAQVAQAPQVITVTPLTDMVYGTTQPASATSDAGLPVALAASGACTLADGTLSTVGVGVCTVTATQDGDASYLPAAPVTVTLDVAKRPDTVTLSELPTIITGVAQLPVTASSAVGLPVTIEGSGACMVVDGDVVTMDVGQCTVTASTVGDDLTEPASDTVVILVSARPASVFAQLVGTVGSDVSDVQVRGSGSGLRPGTSLTLVVQSTPRIVGLVTTSRTGTAVTSAALPALSDGTHHLIATGTSLDGTVVTSQVAFGVEDGVITWVGVPAALAATGPGLDGAATLAALWLLTGAGLVTVRRTMLRRRRVVAR